MKIMSLITHIRGANLWAGINVGFFVGLLVLVTLAPGSPAHAQSCNPAVVSYIVRDEDGKALTEAALKSVSEQLPESIGEARVYVGEASIADDGRTFYWPESVDWAKGKKVPSLQFINSAACAMRLTEVTLTHHDKKMRLIFNVEITRAQSDRRPVIDSLPFQEGTFTLDLNGWSHDPAAVISSERWKKVQDKGARMSEGAGG
ncbi:MAG TPA: hypothetical protein VFD58_21115 [Blastocatellia bacterium]|nr:hypothetical protein [Blastocatellia bacterium]